MTLAELTERYLAERAVSPRYAEHLKAIARRLDSFAGSNSLPDDATIRRWLAEESKTATPASVRTYRRMVLVLLRFAWRRDLIDRPPKDVPTPKAAASIPEAWTAEEVSAIVQVAARWPGMVGEHAAKDWWPALILATYWTAARIGSLLAASPADCDLRNGWLRLRRTKNGREVLLRLHPQAVEALDRIYSPGARRLFAWPMRRGTLWRHLRRIVSEAGVSPTGSHCGLFHRLRRTSLSYCWAVDPSIAQRQADHASAETTRRHYVDPRILAGTARTAADVLPVLVY